ncbi:MAG: ComEC family competence protein [Candidatus Magasanikbacteria bacterium]|nr:ComEC family competence protein [Candidatus Magasanikbacteria bacterium]
MLQKIINSKSKTFLAFCFCFLFGTAFVSILDFSFDFVFIYFGIFVVVGFLIIFWKYKFFRLTSLCVLAILLAFGRYILFFPSETNISNYAEENVRFSAIVIQEPDIRVDSVRYVVNVEKVDKKVGEGRVYFKSELYPRYEYGDKLEIYCKIKKPTKIEDFNFDKYLALKKVFAYCGVPQIRKIGEDEGNILMSSVLSVKNTFAQKINRLWHEPNASFVAGLLYGYRGGLGELQEDFNTTGVTHIVAISGYNIAIIGAIFIVILSFLRIPRKKAFWIIISGIGVFVLFAGASASVVRAGIMGLLVLLAKQLGRMSHPINLLLFTAVAMVLHNPYVLIWDAGFQLSFVATAGLIYLTPKLEIFTEKIPELFGLKKIFLETSAAIIATLPLVLFHFGRFSIVALPTNILILWIIPFIMLGGFLAVISSFIFFPLAQIISWITWIALEYVILIVRWFADFSFASINLSMPAIVVVLFYICLIFYKQIYDYLEIRWLKFRI